MSAKVHFTRINFNKFKNQVDRYSKKHHEAIQELIREAIRVFVHTIVQSYIVIDTGMSAASLEPLAQEVDTTIIDIVAARRKRAVRKGRTTLSGTWYRNSKRDMEAGVKAGYNAYTIKYGSVNQPLVNFEFRIKVFQYMLHEPSWQTLENGISSFRRFIESNYHRYLPDDLDITLNPYAQTGIK
jgi:hypothetical protein